MGSEVEEGQQFMRERPGPQASPGGEFAVALRNRPLARSQDPCYFRGGGGSHANVLPAGVTCGNVSELVLTANPVEDTQVGRL